jgi:hypothetical protein
MLRIIRALWLAVRVRLLGQEVSLTCSRAEADEAYADCVARGWRWQAGLILAACAGDSETVTITWSKASRQEWEAQHRGADSTVREVTDTGRSNQRGSGR